MRFAQRRSPPTPAHNTRPDVHAPRLKTSSRSAISVRDAQRFDGQRPHDAGSRGPWTGCRGHSMKISWLRVAAVMTARGALLPTSTRHRTCPRGSPPVPGDDDTVTSRRRIKSTASAAVGQLTFTHAYVCTRNCSEKVGLWLGSWRSGRTSDDVWRMREGGLLPSLFEPSGRCVNDEIIVSRGPETRAPRYRKWRANVRDVERPQ